MRKTMLVVLVAVLAPIAAYAGQSFTAYGPHLGFSTSPDQVVLGGHLQWGDVAPQLDFVPSLDLGVGDDVTLLTVNGDFHYRIRTSTQWQPYAGAGVALEYASISGSGFGSGDSGTFGGGNLIVGADVATQSHSRFFAELKLGLGSDVPTLKIMAGWSFQPR